MATGVAGTSYTIGGVRLEFPCKAYPTQLSMMSMIIKGIERRQNCLLESPTGSGKSLALLCSCLAWQQNEYRKRDAENMEQVDSKDNECIQVVCTCDCGKGPPPSTVKPSTETSPPPDPKTENCTTPAHPSCRNGACQPSTSGGNCCLQGAEQSHTKSENITDDDDDFQPSKKRIRTSSVPMKTRKKSRIAKGVVFEDGSDPSSETEGSPQPQPDWKMELKTAPVMENPSCPCACHVSKDKDQLEKSKEVYKQRKIPRIYFGTRTHKQITQIVRELGRTAYKNIPMCILGSREYTCVHPTVSAGFHKNEGCKELLEGKHGQSCRFYNGAHKIKNQWQLRDRGLTQAWDIEDLVTLGKKIKACPYFAVRSLKDEADIIFCPYNYLVDPMIRMTMDINMKDQIVVLDEAHNIEDSARDAASCSVTVNQLEETVSELDHHIIQDWRTADCRVMHSVIAALLGWVKSHSTNLAQRDFERALRVWSGTEIVAVLSELGISKDTLATLQHHLNALVEEAEPQKKDQENGASLSSSVGMTLKGLFLIFGFLFKEDMKFMKDFKVAIVKSMSRGNHSRKTDNRWISKRLSDQTWVITLNFWCLNPAVAFSDFGAEVRAIILTSGTLSPMASFQSELGVTFPIQLEANHVIHPSQVWVGTVGIGANGGSLNGSYKNAETYSFQDEIGLLLLHVCQTVPYGVLCFLPSYGMMSKLSQRWKNTGLWDTLEKVKVVMMEARGSDKVNFDDLLKEFYEVIRDCENVDIEEQSVTGALFLAVCRGKVSEGMDFADNNARAVMTIGIPFPSIKDTQVELKRQYNDQYSACRGLLTGSEWYEIQAYRAINQALGRCIRHKRDWGALILVDDRFGRNPKKYITGLSKWVRGKVVHHTYAKNAVASLEEFSKARLVSPCPELPSLSMCASPAPSQTLGISFTPGVATPSMPTNPYPPPTTPYNNENGALQSGHSPVLCASTPMNPLSGSARNSALPSGSELQWASTSREADPTLLARFAGLAPGRDERVVTLSPGEPSGAAGRQALAAAPPPYATAPPSLGAAPAAPAGATLAQRGGALSKRAPLNRLDLNSSPLPGAVTGAPHKGSSAWFEDSFDQGDAALPSVQDATQNPASHAAPTPKKKLSYVDLYSQLKEELLEVNPGGGGGRGGRGGRGGGGGGGGEGGDNQQSFQVIDLTAEDEMEAPSSTPRAEDGRYTPDLFDSEVNEPQPVPSSCTSSSSSSSLSQVALDNAKAPPSESASLRDALPASPTTRVTPPTADAAAMPGPPESRPSVAEDGDCRRPRQADEGLRMRRRRRGRGPRSEEGSGGRGDFLDEIVGKEDQVPAQGTSLCRDGVFCASCHGSLTESTDDVSRVSEAELGARFSFLAGREQQGGKTARGSVCRCAPESEGRRAVAPGLLIRVGAGCRLGNVSVAVAGWESTPRPQRGVDLGLNAHWSEKDGCCYQPIACALCRTKQNATPHVIGYKLVAVGPGGDQSALTPGQAWLFARNTTHCRHLRL